MSLFYTSRVSRISCVSCDAELFQGILSERGHCWNGKDAVVYKLFGGKVDDFPSLKVSEARSLALIQGQAIVADSYCSACGAATGWIFLKSPVASQSGCIGTILSAVCVKEEVLPRLEVGTTAEGSQQERDSLDEKALAFMAEHGIVGMQAAFQVDGRDPVVRAWGFASIYGKDMFMTSKTPLRTASVSKTLTAVAVLQLVAQGKLDLDAKAMPMISRRFNRDFVLGDPKMADITVRHLLHHLAGGFSNHPCCPMFKRQGCAHSDLIAATLEENSLENSPGGTYAYSNFGYCLLGRIIEDALSKEGEGEGSMSYEDYVRVNILEPIGATGTCYCANNCDCEETEHSVGYYTSALDSEHDAWVLSSMGLDNAVLVTRMDAHGGWRMSASDLVKFSQGIEDGTLLDEESRAMLVAVPSSNVNGASNYAMGCCVNTHARWHCGSLRGTASILVRTSTNGGMSWALIVNSHNAAKFPFNELDGFAWTCVSDVQSLS